MSFPGELPPGRQTIEIHNVGISVPGADLYRRHVDLELRHLRMICAIAEAGSVTKAAAALGLAQPALATQLKRIERTVGGPLFHRERRGTRPTPLGDLVLARARLLIPAVNGLQRDVTAFVGSERPGQFRIGATNGPVSGGLVQRLAAAHPNSPVTMHATWSADEICARVLDGRLDYALVGACAPSIPSPGAGLVWLPVCVDPVWVLVGAEHRLAGRDEVPLAEFAGEKWATAPGDGCFNDCFATACARAGFTPLPPYEMDVGSCIDLVAGGAAVVLCQGTVRPLPGVVALPLEGSPLRWRHLLGWDPAGPSPTARGCRSRRRCASCSRPPGSGPARGAEE
ncbi:LysR family transcriptional regulator, partial [Actinoplanes sp. NPDC026623]|uniref:LysR substrate-binding domain-containing protein n=1 Tax=Actinoplanes sp. NPDC026623 TaxID=3155610 RepID=UPI0033EF161C